MEKFRTIRAERVDGVLRITLNRPERRNALSPELQDELLDAVREAQYDTSIRVILIRGAGPSFCAGYDLGPDPSAPPRADYKMPETIEEDVALCMTFGEKWGRLWHSRIPVIAQVHGYCVAGGTDLALHCDMIIAADDARLGFPPVRSQGGPPTHMWVYHAGPQWTKRLLLTGDTISGKKAAEVGLVLESVPAEELDDHALALATRVSHIGHDLLAHNKRIVNLAVELMGRGTMQTLAAIHDTLGHNAPEAFEFNERLRTDGLRAAVAERDGKFA
ncbi:crotonase/enoyl-CoA hydratase family protein [Actinomadura sp. 3N508]|uniref:crotonase/enoyl-CoA hydratase family protein n=1 Tax=Actinomadura sp. 3N508 TaxID=3375153 RepID=UPI00378C8FAC